jgi:hypothetical protein
LQFHQPDEGWTRESAIADRRVSTPEQDAYSDELIALVHAALRGADRTDREAFLLHGLEGFSLDENRRHHRPASGSRARFRPTRAGLHSQYTFDCS